MGRTIECAVPTSHADASHELPTQLAASEARHIYPWRLPFNKKPDDDSVNEEPHDTFQQATHEHNDDGRRHPPEHVARSSSEDVRAFMMALVPSDTIDNAEEAGVTPGAVFVGGTYGLEEEEATVFEGNNHTVDLPIEAHLAPDVADVTAMIAQEVEQRVRQREINQTRVSLITSDIVVADEVKDKSIHGGWNSRSKWVMATFVLLVAGGALGGLLYGFVKDDEGKQVGNSDESSQRVRTEAPVAEPPSLSPVPLETLVNELRPWIAPTVADVARLVDPNSPQSQALVWLQDDPITLTPGRSLRTVLERYALAVLYYSTSGQWWANPFLSRRDVCTWNRGGNTEDLQHKTTKELMEASFWGVYCTEDGESVDVMAFSGSNLVGSLPWELVLLTNMKFINTSQNTLSGTITTRITELARLEVFLVQNNDFTGSIPTTFSPFTWYIDLDGNRLTGSLPESWATSMPALENVFLNGNAVTGTLPTTLGQLSKLVSFQIRNNLLTGTIPSDLRQLISLESLLVMRNLLTGSVAGSLCSSSHEWIDLGADCAEVDCPCCTICCYDNRTRCDEMG
jgi:hypothetical protein